jgi:phage-related protein
MSTPAGGGLIGDATIRVDGDTDPAMRALNQFSRDAQGRIRDVRGRFIAEGALINRSLVNAAGGGDRLGVSLRGLSAAAGSLGAVGARLAGMAVQLGAAVPVAAAVVAGLANVAPAAGLAATGIIAVGTAAAAVKIGMAGVSEAVSAAFDPSDPEKYAAALAKLSPNARGFVEQLRSMQPAFQTLRTQVQDSLFEKLDTTFKRTAAATMPQLSAALRDSAGTLNLMGRGVLDTATKLGTSGALGQALGGATRGLKGLTALPGVLVQGLVQIGAAAAPAFERIGKSAAGPIQQLSEGLTRAFESGAMQKAIETAIGLLKDLGAIAGNLASVVGSVFSAAQVSGGGFIGTLKEITGALKTAFASPAVQSGLQALFGTMATLAQTAAPLLGQALGAVAPILTALGPPVQRLIENLGSALSPIIEALGPVLATAADAVGILVDAVSPLLPVVGNLIASLLPPLVPLIRSIGDVFAQAGPVVQLLGEALTTALAPIIAQLPALIAPLATHLSTMARMVFPMLARLVVQLAPSLAQVGAAFGQVLAAAGPLLTALSQLTVGLVSGLMPVITPLIGVIAKLAAIFAGHLSRVLTTVVVPAIGAITALLRGDFSGAWDKAKTVVSGAISTMNTLFQGLPGKLFTALASMAGKLRQRATEGGSALVSTISTKISEAVAWVRGLPGRAFSALASLGGRLRDRAAEAGRSMVSTISTKIGEAVGVVSGLPGRAASALGDLGGRLYSSGRALVSGFVNGILSKIGDVVSAAGSVVSKARDLFPGSPAKVGPFSGRGWVLYSGQAISESLAAGMAERQALVQRAAEAVARAAQGAVSVPRVARPMVSGLGSGEGLGVGMVRTGVVPGTTVITNHVHLANHGVLGSPFEVRDWLASALDDLNRMGRLPKTT